MRRLKTRFGRLIKPLRYFNFRILLCLFEDQIASARTTHEHKNRSLSSQQAYTTITYQKMSRPFLHCCLQICFQRDKTRTRKKSAIISEKHELQSERHGRGQRAPWSSTDGAARRAFRGHTKRAKRNIEWCTGWKGTETWQARCASGIWQKRRMGLFSYLLIKLNVSARQLDRRGHCQKLQAHEKDE